MPPASTSTGFDKKTDIAEKSDDFAGLRVRSSAAPAKPLPAKHVSGMAADRLALDDVQKNAPPSSWPKPEAKPAPAKDFSTLAAGKPQAAYRPSDSAPAVAAMADQAYEKKAAERESVAGEERFAQPPPALSPPPPPPAPVAQAPAANQEADDDNSVAGAIARTREQRQRKVVEALANQALGGMANSPPATPPATPPAIQGAPVAGSLGRGPGSNSDDGQAALGAVKEQLRRNQCDEANAALLKLERSFPATHGLAETRAEWQNVCGAQQQMQLERRMRNEAAEPQTVQSPLPAAPSRSYRKAYASPAPPKAPPAHLKAKAAPQRSNVKAADAVPSL
jgi:hypothetical protein